MGCGRRTTPDELDRIARRPDGRLAVGRGEPGRGAWLCRANPGCFERAVRRQSLERALRRPLQTVDIEVLRATLYGAEPPPAP